MGLGKKVEIEKGGIEEVRYLVEFKRKVYIGVVRNKDKIEDWVK